ncbi:MAG: NAD-dependent epimerase/dehydratase family protein [Candidatus Omnitrophica bacterium]|nr:NAD-dependent epimerase/dehydratase family protein [Candidatus Omnitrophota bacterium]
MQYRTILITGGAGFIGSNLAVSLKERFPKLKVIVLDNLKRRGSQMSIRRLGRYGIVFIHGDVRCPEDLFLDTHIDLLIECSAEPAVLAGYNKNPLYIINTNLTGAINCFELARRHKADIIFLSTSRVYSYENINEIKITEEETRFVWSETKKIKGWSKDGINEDFSIDGPKTLYGATKLAAELVLQEYLKNYGIRGLINRCGVITGPWQFGKLEQGVFSYWMLAHYFKWKLNYIGFRGKGKQVRDLLHINDLFELILLQMRSIHKLSGKIYNVGGGNRCSLSLLEATRLCQEISGNRIEIGRVQQTRPGDVIVYITDNYKVTKELGWQPKFSPEEILLDIYKWIHCNAKQLKYLR